MDRNKVPHIGAHRGAPSVDSPMGGNLEQGGLAIRGRDSGLAGVEPWDISERRVEATATHTNSTTRNLASNFHIMEAFPPSLGATPARPGCPRTPHA
jgi:hypothetical protein